MATLGYFWKQFTDLLPTTPRYVGVVVSVGAANRYTIELLGGGLITATSDVAYSVGAKVFVLGGKIEGSAPSLQAETIEI